MGYWMFVLDEVGVSVKKKVILEAINLQLCRNKIYGIIGHNGSGKSTLIKLLARQESISEGSIYLDKQLIKKYSYRDYAKKVAYLPQYLPSHTMLTTYELVKMGRYARTGIRQNSVDDESIIQDVLQKTGTLHLENEMVDNLSGGERQRVWIAMCLAQQTEFLLLDEPLASLDIAYQIEIMELIQKLVDEFKMGVIIIIHNINFAAHYCHELIALSHGRIIYQDQAENIMQPEILKAIYNVDITLADHPETGKKYALI
ncbi:ATP-binding cassette domain-containing protein [Neisseriaceae bacterium PsAf]|nr:ATP-binding cassette domain-containing protein [Neisseriaceae bacterium PsAf]